MRKSNNFKSGSQPDNPFSDALANALGTVNNDLNVDLDNDHSNIDKAEISLKGLVEIYFEKKGRAGKMVTLLDFTNVEGDGLISLAKELKSSCGVGGSLNGIILLLQGDVRDKCELYLINLGLKSKRIGG